MLTHIKITVDRFKNNIKIFFVFDSNYFLKVKGSIYQIFIYIINVNNSVISLNFELEKIEK